MQNHSGIILLWSTEVQHNYNKQWRNCKAYENISEHSILTNLRNFRCQNGLLKSSTRRKANWRLTTAVNILSHQLLNTNHDQVLTYNLIEKCLLTLHDSIAGFYINFGRRDPSHQSTRANQRREGRRNSLRRTYEWSNTICVRTSHIWGHAYSFRWEFHKNTTTNSRFKIVVPRSAPITNQFAPSSPISRTDLLCLHPLPLSAYA